MDFIFIFIFICWVSCFRIIGSFDMHLSLYVKYLVGWVMFWSDLKIKIMGFYLCCVAVVSFERSV